MAHMAELDGNNKVIRVIVVNNEELLVNGVESEDKGIQFCKSLYGENTIWKQTSYNATFRKNYAGAGMEFDSLKDAFIPIKPYPSWVLNESTCRWEAPVAYPNDGKFYAWKEESTSWVEEVK